MPMSIEFPSAEMEMESQALREIVEKEDEVAVDFSKLNKKLIQVSLSSLFIYMCVVVGPNPSSLKTKDVEAINKQFLTKLQSMNLELQKIAPNLKAIEQFDNVVSRLKTSENVFEEAREKAKVYFIFMIVGSVFNFPSIFF